jgi:hypothetical protein
MIEWARYGTGKSYLMHRASMSIEPISFDVTEPKRERTSTPHALTEILLITTPTLGYRIFTLLAFPVRRTRTKSHLGRGIANYIGKPTDTRLEVYRCWT